MSPSKTFYFFFAINIFLALFVWFLVPETKKVSLEEIDVLFGGSNHVEKGGNLLHVNDANHASMGVDTVVTGGAMEMRGVSKERGVGEIKEEEIREAR